MGADPQLRDSLAGLGPATLIRLSNTASGYLDTIDLLAAHDVDRVGIEGSASWGELVAIAVVAAGFDASEVPAQRSAARRRSRRLDKTDTIDAIDAVCALLAEPSLGPVQTLEVYYPLATGSDGSSRSSTKAEPPRRQIRQLERDLAALLDERGTTLRDEPGIGPIAAATLVCEVGGPFRFTAKDPGSRRINSVLYIASITQHPDIDEARAYVDRKLAEGKTRREARRAHKQHLTNRVICRMSADEHRRRTPNYLAA